MHKHQRPGAATAAADGMKLHYRRVRIEGREYTVITPRPGTDGRFSTNRFHETWHVLSDWHGARLLGRLLWGLAYQRRPGTVVMIGAPFLDPNPFDAAPSSPILLVPSLLTPLRESTARQLRRMALSGPGDGTVRWQTPGLDPAVAEQRARWELGRSGRAAEFGYPANRPVKGPEMSVRMLGGMLTFAAGPQHFRDYAVDVSLLGTYAWHGTDHTYFGPWPHQGEVQVFADYRRRVTAATRAREEVLAEVAAGEHEERDPRLPGNVEPIIWDRGTEIRRRRLPAVPAQAAAAAPAAAPAPATV